MVSGIGALLGVYRGALFGTSWRRRLNVSLGLSLYNWSSFKPPSSGRFLSEGQDPDLFVFARLPQFSNNFPSHIENVPGLAFESQGFRQKSSFLDQLGFRIDCVCH
jgi:hypothetical protein